MVYTATSNQPAWVPVYQSSIAFLFFTGLEDDFLILGVSWSLCALNASVLGDYPLLFLVFVMGDRLERGT